MSKQRSKQMLIDSVMIGLAPNVQQCSKAGQGGAADRTNATNKRVMAGLRPLMFSDCTCAICTTRAAAMSKLSCGDDKDAC